MPRIALSSLALIMMTACTQPAARVDMRGAESFARDSTARSGDHRDNRSYAIYQPPKRQDGYQPYEPPPIYTNTKPVSQESQQAASLQSVSSSDLPPPAAAPSAPPERVNPWTNRERVGQHEDERSDATPAAPPADKKYVKLIKPSGSASGFIWPVASHKVMTPFGPKGSGKSNDGINIASPEGEPVWAAAGGEVVYASNDLKGYGNMVIIKHAGGKSTSYAHLSRAKVEKYDRVKQGDIIGFVGSTGRVKKPQLFFAVRDGNTPVDPGRYVSTNVAGLR